MPPPSSKKRSATTRLRRSARRRAIALPARTYATACSAPRAVEAALGDQPRYGAAASSRSSIASRRRETSRDSSSVRPGRFAVPERNRRRRAVRVLDAHDARLDAPDPPRRRAEQEDVAGHALDGEVFVERADDVSVGLGDDGVVGGLGDRAAGGDRGEARAAARRAAGRSPDRGAGTRRCARARSRCRRRASSTTSSKSLRARSRYG